MALLSSLEDPLAPHLDRLSSTTETDPCGKFTLLHEMVFLFETDRRYLNDIRYVRLWLEYASYFADPHWVYTHMLSKAIGVYIGAVYEQMAEYYIGRQRWKDADRVLCQGIAHRAEPAAKLQHKLHQVRHQVYQEKNAIQAAAERAKGVPEHILHLFDWINTKLAYQGRKAMVKECFVYTHEETSFEEIRARRWRRKRTYDQPAPKRILEDHKKNVVAPAPVEHGELRPRSDAKTIVRPVIERTDDGVSLPVVVGVPHEPAFVKRILAELRPPLTSYIGFHDLSHIDHRPRVTNRKIELDSQTFTVVRKLGQGGMARVFELTSSNSSSSYAAKVESPPNPWEFYMCRQAANRAPHVTLAVHAFYLYANTSILLMDVASKGTLLDALNTYRSDHNVAAMPEPLVISLTHQLVTAVAALHSTGIIHGDIKIDNVVMLDEEAGGEQRIGLIDFGRAVDLRMLPENSRLEPRWTTQPGSIDPPMPPPWHPWLVDKWGLASILHLLLFGKPMETAAHPPTGPQHQDQQQRWGIRERVRRYWKKEAWEALFDELLNNGQRGVDAAAVASLLPQRSIRGMTAGLTKI